ncbi:aminotransferase class I/II-fold pyridoxal phosphate-dependent enzyme [Nocardia brevicatena]|uniref:aminotransferase class I/II-fold pyridoxal phosphate-dependent enzyme n=1 Tax=Nocardia brevicatena TaxID=37327 RepID=UPI0014616354|nr:aminotransferase class I/II-fold pyridoxal phosphate-dependent enzyme [Nocardia brevicatena]
MPVRKAVILAAGLGRRLGGDTPKPLTVIDGTPIVHRALRQLAAVGVRETVLVVGHRADDIMASVGDRFDGMRVSYIVSETFADTNNAFSLWLARHHLDEDTYVLDGDVVFDAEILVRLATAPDAVISAVSEWRNGMNGTVVTVDGMQRVARFLLPPHSSDIPDTARKTINVHLLRAKYLRAEFVPQLEQLIESGGHNEFYERVLATTTARGMFPVRAVDCTDLPWYEIDDIGDVIAAECLLGDDESRLSALESLHGGYWRFDVADHCLMINPYFPTSRLLDELTGDLAASLINYPMGRIPLQRLLAAAVGLPEDRLVIANGASELITALGRVLDNVVLVVPGFNEYESALASKRCTRFELQSPDFEFDVHRCVDVAVENAATAVVVTSPNNPTSRAVPREDLLLLCKQLADRRIRLLVDESFVDFCPEESSVADELGTHLNLTVIKSMSKAYGVGGLRLGYLATADEELREQIRLHMPVWNINGIAETFLRRLPGFAADYRAAVDRVRADRDEFYRELCAVPGVTVLRPDANFILLRLPDPWRARDVARRLLTRFRILVKDCSGKSMPDADRYLRISCRTAPENHRVTRALAAVLASAPAGASVVG